MHEAVLRRSFHRRGEAHDQALWSILDVDWLAIRGRTFEQELRLPQRWH
jgi:hypothetical protein